MNTFKTTSQPQMPVVLGDTLIPVHRNFKRMLFRVSHCFKQSPVGKGHVEALYLQGGERVRDLPAGSSRSPFSTRQSTLDSSLGPSVSWDCHLDPAGSLWEAEASGGPVPPMRTCTVSPSSGDGACQGSQACGNLYCGRFDETFPTARSTQDIARAHLQGNKMCG